MHWISWVANSSVIFLTYIGILGLLIGSFLNVVIVRLPVMLHREWLRQCQTYLQEQHNTIPPLSPSIKHEVFNLISPRSHCPACKHVIKVWENIPVLSFLMLKGHCSACTRPIGWRYPILEVFTALCSIITAHHFGFTWITLWALILTWSLITLTVIDWDHQLLPDEITLPLLWLGLIINSTHTFTSLYSAVIGAIIGYLFLWSVYWLFKLITKKEGMGYGDFKLLSMLGAYLGWQAIPLVVLISSFLGVIIGGGLVLFKRHPHSQPFAFGPFLAAAGWIALMWGDKLNNLYLHHVVHLV